MSRRVGNDILGWAESYPVEFFGNPSDRRYYGVELEIDDGNLSKLRYYLNGDERVDNTIFLVEDGSLDNGVEIVSNPMSLEYHKETSLWGILTRYASQARFSSHDTSTCGLHIHVSKDAISDDAIDNLLFLNERFWQKWVAFSRRKPEEMERWASKLTEQADVYATKRNVKETAVSNKYNAINLDGEDTIEFRIFKGTLAASTIYATLDMVDYMIDFAEKYADSNELDIDTITWGSFIGGINPDSRVLLEYLDKRGILIEDEVLITKELEERMNVEIDAVVDEVRELASSILYGEGYNEDLAVINEAVTSYMDGDGLHIRSIDRTRVVGDRIIIHNVEDNPYGAGMVSNYDEVLQHTEDDGRTAGLDERRRYSGYSYTASIASRLLQVNPITLYDSIGSKIGTFKYAFLNSDCELMLCNMYEPSFGLSTIKDIQSLSSDKSITYKKMPDNIEDTIGSGAYEVLRVILESTEPEKRDRTPLRTFKTYLRWLTEMDAALSVGGEVAE